MSSSPMNSQNPSPGKAKANPASQTPSPTSGSTSGSQGTSSNFESSKQWEENLRVFNPKMYNMVFGDGIGKLSSSILGNPAIMGFSQERLMRLAGMGESLFQLGLPMSPIAQDLHKQSILSAYQQQLEALFPKPQKPAATEEKDPATKTEDPEKKDPADPDAKTTETDPAKKAEETKAAETKPGETKPTETANGQTTAKQDPAAKPRTQRTPDSQLLDPEITNNMLNQMVSMMNRMMAMQTPQPVTAKPVASGLPMAQPFDPLTPMSGSEGPLPADGNKKLPINGTL